MGAEGVALFVSLFIFLVHQGEVHQVMGLGALGSFPLLNYSQNCEIKKTGLTFFSPSSTCLLRYYLH